MVEREEEKRKKIESLEIYHVSVIWNCAKMRKLRNEKGSLYFFSLPCLFKVRRTFLKNEKNLQVMSRGSYYT
jgi:hypothetical protein